MLRYTYSLLMAVAVSLLFTAAPAPSYASDAPAVPAVRYTCPMHPQIITDAPGTCPICGMTLVPLENHDHGVSHEGEKPVIALEAGTIQTMGVRTEKVERRGDMLTVSNSAVLRSSEGAHVIRALGEGRFQGRDVTIGAVEKGRTQIRSGLAEGDEVVSRAEFMIDAESNLREALDTFQGGEHAGH